MSVDVIVPKLGLTMEEGTVVEWHRDDGEAVSRGQPLFTVETDKVAYEVAAEADGFLERLVGVDVALPVGALVGRLHERPAAGASRGVAGTSSVVAGRAAPPATRAAAVPPADAAGVAPPAAPPSPHPATLLASVRPDGARVLVSPVARRIAAERGIDVSTLAGTGPGGVVLKRDVESAAPQRSSATSGAARPEASAKPSLALPEPATGEAGSLRRRPLSGMRRTIAQRMTASLGGSAQMTAFARVDMGEAERLRRMLVDDADAIGARITVTDVVLKCVAVALAESPRLREWIESDEIVATDEVNVCLAIALDDGLVAPVLRNVDRLSLAELSRARVGLIDRARSGRLTAADLQGGAFTLSNFGSYGGDFETPILNPPQSAMLGIGRIADDVVARDGMPVVRPTMWLSMTYDHRLIDGATAGRFRARLKALLEQPQRLLAVTR